MVNNIINKLFKPIKMFKILNLEIFFNETLAKDEIDRLFDPKVLTNFKKYTEKGDEKVKDFSRDENLANYKINIVDGKVAKLKVIFPLSVLIIKRKEENR